MSGISSSSFHVLYMCKSCNIFFKSVETYCNHKVKFHFTQFTKSWCIVFEESVGEPTVIEPLNNSDQAIALREMQVMHGLEDRIDMEIKKESLENGDRFTVGNITTVNSRSNSIEYNPASILALKFESENEPGIKTEWMEEETSVSDLTYQDQHHPNEFFVNKPQKHEDFNKINRSEDEKSNCFSVDVDLGDEQVEDPDRDPLGDFDVSPESVSTSIIETRHEYFNENTSDSDDDIICLDNPISTMLSIIPTCTSVAITTPPKSNNVILSEFKFKCQMCSKKFNSEGQLGIHVGICQIFNSRKRGTSAGTGRGAGPGSVLVVRSSHKKRKRAVGNDNLIKCKECSKLIRPRNVKSHAKDHRLEAMGKVGRPHVCQICGSSFRRKDHLLYHHIGIHSNETPFTCTFPNCDSAFKYKMSLHRHLKTHTRA